MPLYSYKCEEHDIFDVLQGMNDKHEALCPICLEKAIRIYYPSQLKCTNSKMGKTRMELFDNMAKDGFASKEWREHDSYYQRAMGIID